MKYDEKQLDELLEQGLREYSQVEPRGGLEERVLANLRTQPEARAWWRLWVPALAAAAVIAVVVAMALRTEKPQTKVATMPPAVTGISQAAVEGEHGSETRATQGQATQAHATQGRGAKASREVATQRRQSVREPQGVVAVAQALPRMDTFPAAAPVTEEERLLMSFYRSAPAEAVEAASAQSSERARVQKYFESGEAPAVTPEGPRGRE